MNAEDEKLALYFDSLKREDCYRVDEVLKESPSEVTQRVSLVAADGTVKWPFIRKFIKRESGMGIAYERIFEAQRAGRRFKHIPSIKECYANDEDLVVVMELVVGETLQELVDRVGPSMRLARNVFPQLCEAVSELHESFDPPIIHRDLTPANIVLAEGGLALIDFGIAREYREGAWADTTRFGTRSFAPPEQYGFGQTTVRSDVFALGTVLYFCLAGLVPDVYVTDDDYADARISPEVHEVVARATAIDPVNRYGSARELLGAFLQASNCEQESRQAAVHPAQGDACGFATAANERPSAQRASGRPEGMRFATAGIIWNVLLALVAAFFLIACVASFIEPSGVSAGYPVWVNVLDYLVLMPATIIAGAWMLVDKRRLAQRFPRLQKRRPWHWALLFAIVFCAMFLGVGLSGMAAESAAGFNAP